MGIAFRGTLTGVGVVLVAACAGGGSAPATDGPDPRLGYGTPAEEDRTGAVESITPEAVGGQHVASIEEMLEGRVPGLLVTRGANGVTLRIRNPVSLNGNPGEPLLVIDGMPIRPGGLSSALLGLNPNEVERIEVLKDASSTAVYGTRGAHGVILIALKR